MGYRNQKLDDQNDPINKLAGNFRRIAIGIGLLILLAVILIVNQEYRFLSSANSMQSDSLAIVDGIHVETGLIAEDGYKLLIENCESCHSMDLVVQNRQTREGWNEIILWMQKDHKLWDLGENEETILDYLEINYSPEGYGRRENLEEIEWYICE